MLLGRQPIRAGGPVPAAAPGALRKMPTAFTQTLLDHVDPKFHHLVHALRRRGSWGEGTCFFHSLLAELNWKGYNTKSERQQKVLAYKFRCGLGHFITVPELEKELIVSRMRRDELPRSAADLEEKLCDPKVWADEIIIRAVSRLFHCNLLFWDGVGNQFYCGVHGSNAPAQPLFIILWIDHSHFEGVVLTDKRGRMLADAPGMFEPGHPIHMGVLAMYRHLCRLNLPRPKYVPDVLCNNQNHCTVKRLQQLQAGAHILRQRLHRFPMSRGNLHLPRSPPLNLDGAQPELRGGASPEEWSKQVLLEPKGAPRALLMPKHIAIAFHGYSAEDRRFVLATLNNRELGWGKYGLVFHDAAALPAGAPPHTVHIELHLATPDQLAALFPEDNMAKWSVTQADVKPVRIYMNTQNWNAGNTTSGHASLAAYRRYVINHEFGHAFGYSHDTGTPQRKEACIMQQQTWGTGGGAPTEWPADVDDCFHVVWSQAPHILGVPQ